ARIVGSVSYTDAFEKLKKGEVDAILADDSLLYGFLMDNKGFKILPKRYTKEFYAIAVEKSKNDELKKLLNNILQNMQETGALHRVRQKWIPQGTPNMQ
ncbi:putative ABC-type glutamine transporter, substrate binding periplasmic protein, partial [Candidatus Gastranaerophilus sp. (ex Termes propinquus)]